MSGSSFLPRRIFVSNGSFRRRGSDLCAAVGVFNLAPFSQLAGCTLDSLPLMQPVVGDNVTEIPPFAGGRRENCYLPFTCEGRAGH